MTDNTKNSYYQLSLNILKALGGDTSISFPDADAIWDEIYKIYDHSGGRFDIVPLEKTITENGQYDYYPDNNADAFMPVNLTINVPQKYTDEQVAEIENVARQDGYNTGYSSGFIQGETEGYNDGFSEGLDEGYSDGVIAQKEKLESITLTDNGTYTKEDGWDEVTVEVEGVIPDEELQQMLQEAMDEGYQDGYSEGVDDGREEQKQELESVTFRENGTYTREDGWNSVTVEVAGSGGGTGKPKIYNGFRLNEADDANKGNYATLATIDFSQYDWSSVYDLSYFFGNFGGAPTNFRWSTDDFANFNEHYNGKVMSCQYIVNPASGTGGGYLGSTAALSFLNNRMHDCLDMRYMFYNCSKLSDTSSMTLWDTSNVVTTSNMFNSCSSLTSVALFDTSNVIDMSRMFQGCGNLTTVPQFNTSNVTNMGYMFYYCKKLVSVPQFNTSNVTDMNNMFNSCSSLTSVPQFNTSNVTNMGYMFQGCSGLTSVPELDFSNVTNMSYMFNNCSSLLELPNINCKKITSFDSWWYASKTEKIGIIDCSSVTNASYIFVSSTVMTDAGGCRNLGMQSSVSNTNGNYFLYNVPNLTYESLINIFNLLYDRASAGYSVLTLKLHPTQMEKLSDDDKLIAINKGWSLTV